ncbi:hypothetical protein L6452_22286 [Arctium lappa]|uniref:Uncharacterized protein n=1 Tax=Arctium lappa TaxID=4217 RepID=A0ACB9AYS2_ARCLA|nr:hypothetical protein L6452_22286 [Arctium lappa]
MVSNYRLTASEVLQAFHLKSTLHPSALHVHAHFKFGPLSVYLSINYLDRFLAVYELPDNHDFSVCCPLANKHVDCKLLNASICKTIFLVVAPVSVFCVFVARKLMYDFDDHWEYQL